MAAGVRRAIATAAALPLSVIGARELRNEIKQKSEAVHKQAVYSHLN